MAREPIITGGDSHPPRKTDAAKPADQMDEILRRVVASPTGVGGVPIAAVGLDESPSARCGRAHSCGLGVVSRGRLELPTN